MFSIISLFIALLLSTYLCNATIIATQHRSVLFYCQVVFGLDLFGDNAYAPTIITQPETTVDVEDLDEEGNENAYASENWARNLYNEIIADDGTVTYEEADYVRRCWRGYTDETGSAPVPYLLPISTTTIGASNYLNNDGYNLGL